VGYYAYSSMGGSPAKAVAKAEPAKVFTGGEQGFLSLRLKEVENINHNTKKFRFEFDDKDAVSGMPVACT